MPSLLLIQAAGYSVWLSASDAGLARLIANLSEQGLARPWLDRRRVREEWIGRAAAAAKAHFVWAQRHRH
jgi:hypothetical protein